MSDRIQFSGTKGKFRLIGGEINYSITENMTECESEPLTSSATMACFFARTKLYNNYYHYIDY